MFKIDIAFDAAVFKDSLILVRLIKENKAF
jgi:hypothetical protein